MSATATEKLAAQKAKRQKLILAVGTVVLLALLGYQLPKLLGGGGEPETAATTQTTQVASAPSSSPIATGAKLPNTDRVVIQRDSDQLLSFGLFESKDPFVQQLTPVEPTPIAAPTATTPSSPPPASTVGVGLTPPPSTPASGSPSAPTTPAAPGAAPGSQGDGLTGTTTSPTEPPAPPTSALISTNGVCQSVAVNGSFPTGEDIFKLISIAKDGKSVEIGVVGGSYDTGQPTATLKLGEKLTLVNTADGTRYVITLKSKCDLTKAPTTTAQTTTTTPATTTTTPVPPAPPATTTTVTTPIVTDSLDTPPTPTGQ